MSDIVWGTGGREFKSLRSDHFSAAKFGGSEGYSFTSPCALSGGIADQRNSRDATYLNWVKLTTTGRAIDRSTARQMGRPMAPDDILRTKIQNGLLIGLTCLASALMLLSGLGLI
jgi:hypothetical protein